MRKGIEGQRAIAPHSEEVLHHELVQSFGRVGHVHFAFSVSKVRLVMLRVNEVAEAAEVVACTFSVMYIKAAAWSR